jgi:hypothetical protein
MNKLKENSTETVISNVPRPLESHLKLHRKIEPTGHSMMYGMDL